MLAGYYDDSYDDDVFVVGGFVGCALRWQRFSDEWEAALDQSPRLEYYKASEANVRPEERKPDNPFLNFSRGMIQAKEKVLARIIVAHAEYAVYSTLERKDFSELIRPRVERPKRGMGRYRGHEYLFPFHGCIAATAKYLKEHNVNDQVDFFFDEQGKVGKWGRDMYEEMKAMADDWQFDNDPRPYLGVCVPHDDKKVVALQAADMFASRARKYDKVGASENDPAAAILSALPCMVSNWQRAGIQNMVDKWYPEGTDE